MTRSERASQIWAVLAWLARNHQTLTHAHLGKLIGVPSAGMGQLLEPIQSYCLINKLPPLTILVVQQDSGLPGSGFRGATAPEYAKSQAEVFAFDWHTGTRSPRSLRRRCDNFRRMVSRAIIAVDIPPLIPFLACIPLSSKLNKIHSGMRVAGRRNGGP